MAMQHAVADGRAAAERARSGHVAGWHPVLAAVETEAGTWFMVDEGRRRCYGVIRLLRIKGEAGYRAVTWAENPNDRQLIGYYRTLRAACAATHTALLATYGNPGPPNGGRVSS